MPDAAKASPILPVALAFVAGFVDCCGFIALFNLFTAHVTGNFVLLGAALVGTHPGVLAKLLALPVFVLVVAATRLWLNRHGDAAGSVRDVLLAEFVLLALFFLAGISAAPVMDPDSAAVILASMLAVGAMAVQNAASRTVFVTLAPTTIMTGNVTQIVLDLVDYLAARSEHVKAAARARVVKLGPPILAFAGGAVAGALGFGYLGFWCLIAPLAIVGTLLARKS